MGDYTANLLTPTLVIPSAFTTGNGQAAWTAPCDCKLIGVSCSIETLGGTSDGDCDTDIMIRNDTDTLDMLSTAMLLDHDADPTVAEGSLHATAANVLLDDGDVVEVDIDGVCSGAAEAGLSVYLYLIGR